MEQDVGPTWRSVVAITGAVLGVVLTAAFGFVVSSLFSHTAMPSHPEAGIQIKMLEDTAKDIRSDVKAMRESVTEIDRKQVEQTAILRSIELQLRQQQQK